MPVPHAVGGEEGVRGRKGRCQRTAGEIASHDSTGRRARDLTSVRPQAEGGGQGTRRKACVKSRGASALRGSHAAADARGDRDAQAGTDVSRRGDTPTSAG